MSGIKLSNVSKSYSGIPAVRSLSLDILDGEFLTLLGPSGCGKTTTLRMIAGLEDADDGEIAVGEKVFYSREKGIYLPPEKRKLGFIFQSYALWPHMTVKKNISLGLEQKGMLKDEIEETVDRVLVKVQLEGLGGRYPSELSGGQQQRVAVARMVAMEPEIFLMDEPLSNLDAMLRIDMRTELKRLHHELKATTVYVTHDQNEALTLSDRIAVMNNGEIRQIGTPEEIYKKPEDLFVARFVGSPRINILKGSIRNKDDSVLIFSGDFDTERKIDGYTGDVAVTIRPEDIKIDEKKKKGWLEAKVYSVLPAGSETIVYIKYEDTSITIKMNGFSYLKEDDTVWFYPDPERMNFYNSETEKIII